MNKQRFYGTLSGTKTIDRFPVTDSNESEFLRQLREIRAESVDLMRALEKDDINEIGKEEEK